MIGTIQRWVEDAHKNALSKGWWENDNQSFPEKLMLCVSELAEALEEYRAGRRIDEVYDGEKTTLPDGTTITKPEGIPVELADCVIRIFDLCGRYEINLGEILYKKMEFNKSRSYRHGGKKA